MSGCIKQTAQPVWSPGEGRAERLEGPGYRAGEITQDHRAPGMGMDLKSMMNKMDLKSMMNRMNKNVKID